MALTALFASGAVPLVPLAAPAAAASSCGVAYSGEILVEPGTEARLAADVTGDVLAVANRSVTFSLSDGVGGILQYGARSDALGRARVTASVPEGVYGVVASVAGSALHPGCATRPEPNDALLSEMSTGARLGGTGTIAPAAGVARFGLRLRTLSDGSLSGSLGLRIFPPGPIRPLAFRATTVAFPPGPAVEACRADIVGSGVLDGQPGYTYAATAVDTGRKTTDFFSFVGQRPRRRSAVLQRLRAPVQRADHRLPAQPRPADGSLPDHLSVPSQPTPEPGRPGGRRPGKPHAQMRLRNLPHTPARGPGHRAEALPDERHTMTSEINARTSTATSTVALRLLTSSSVQPGGVDGAGPSATRPAQLTVAGGGSR